jgi:hypothetical protein
LDDDDDVDMEEFRPCVDRPAAGPEELSPGLSLGDFEGEDKAAVSSSSLLLSAAELGCGLKAGMVLMAFLF